MIMIDLGTNLIISGALSLSLSGALFWLLRSWISERLKNSIKHEYDKNLESHKVQLQAQTAVEVERLRSQLSMQATEHAVKFQRLHEKRAEVIGELYSLLTDAYWKVSTFTSLEGKPGMPQNYLEAHKSLSVFFDYFDRNRFYLPSGELCNSIEVLTKEIWNHIERLNMYLSYEEERLPVEAREKKHDAWRDAWEFMQQEAPVARSKLENEFRAILGGL